MFDEIWEEKFSCMLPQYCYLLSSKKFASVDDEFKISMTKIKLP